MYFSKKNDILQLNSNVMSTGIRNFLNLMIQRAQK